MSRYLVTAVVTTRHHFIVAAPDALGPALGPTAAADLVRRMAPEDVRRHGMAVGTTTVVAQGQPMPGPWTPADVRPLLHQLCAGTINTARVDALARQALTGGAT